MHKALVIVFITLVIVCFLFAVPALASQNNIEVTVTVLETIGLRQLNDQMIIETNIKSGFYYFINDEAYTSTQEVSISTQNIESFVLISGF
jgi:hypothetical protein